MNDGRPPQDPLATWTGQVLGQLPPRRAPASLAPRVLQALARQQALPWYRRPWLEWPRGYQVVTALAALALIAAGGWWLLPHADAVSLSAATGVASQLDSVREVGTVADILRSIGQALILLVRNLHSWVLAGVLAVFAVIWTTTLGLGTACWRLAASGR